MIEETPRIQNPEHKQGDRLETPISEIPSIEKRPYHEKKENEIAELQSLDNAADANLNFF